MVKCPRCGKEFFEENDFCGNCGYNLKLDNNTYNNNQNHQLQNKIRLYDIKILIALLVVSYSFIEWIHPNVYALSANVSVAVIGAFILYIIGEYEKSEKN